MVKRLSVAEAFKSAPLEGNPDRTLPQGARASRPHLRAGGPGTLEKGKRPGFGLPALLPLIHPPSFHLTGGGTVKAADPAGASRRAVPGLGFGLRKDQPVLPDLEPFAKLSCVAFPSGQGVGTSGSFGRQRIECPS